MYTIYAFTGLAMAVVDFSIYKIKVLIEWLCHGTFIPWLKKLDNIHAKIAKSAYLHLFIQNQKPGNNLIMHLTDVFQIHVNFILI